MDIKSRAKLSIPKRFENAKSNVNVELIDVVVQGNQCPKNICYQLEKIKSILGILYLGQNFAKM